MRRITLTLALSAVVFAACSTASADNNPPKPTTTTAARAVTPIPEHYGFTDWNGATTTAVHYVGLLQIEQAAAELIRQAADYAVWSAEQERLWAEEQARIAAEQAEQARIQAEQQTARDAAARAAAAVRTPSPVAATSGGGGSCGVIPQYIIQRESGGNPAAVNPSSGAFGCHQFLPSTWSSSCSDLGPVGTTSVSAQNECAARISNGGQNLNPWAETR